MPVTDTPELKGCELLSDFVYSFFEHNRLKLLSKSLEL